MSYIARFDKGDPYSYRTVTWAMPWIKMIDSVIIREGRIDSRRTIEILDLLISAGWKPPNASHATIEAGSDYLDKLPEKFLKEE